MLCLHSIRRLIFPKIGKPNGINLVIFNLIRHHCYIADFNSSRLDILFIRPKRANRFRTCDAHYLLPTAKASGSEIISSVPTFHLEATLLIGIPTYGGDQLTVFCSTYLLDNWLRSRFY